MEIRRVLFAALLLFKPGVNIGRLMLISQARIKRSLMPAAAGARCQSDSSQRLA
jgi:hypothetical protein